MITNLIFDIGGVVIYSPRIDWGLKDKLFNLEPGTIRNIVDDCFKKRSVNKDFDEKSYFEINYSKTLDWSDYQNILTEFYSNEKPNYELIDWIRAHKPRYKVFALTNNSAALKGLLQEKFMIDDLFDIVFNSAEIGLAKPDPKLFQYMLDKINAKADQCLFVDDNSKNVDAAIVIGFNTIYFTDNDSFLKQISKLETILQRSI